MRPPEPNLARGSLERRMQRFMAGRELAVVAAIADEVHDTAYAKAMSYHDIHGLTRAICAALVGKPGPLTGAEFRFLRLHLRLSQVSLGKLLDVSEQSVASWEKRGRIPPPADKHLRLLWIEKHNGNEPIVRIMNRLNDVERLSNQKFLARESRTKG